REYRALGINTLDLYIPWNWHELKDGEFDFEGRTNPRRNLRALLALIAEQGFKLIARPGPEILNEWKHGGLPAWLVERPEYKMNPVDWAEGRYAPLDNLNPHDAEAAARGWLENSTHMEYARRWLTTVAKELAPYSARRLFHIGSENSAQAPRDTSGPLLFVQLGDDFAEGRANRAGPEFWRYVESLRTALEAGGVDVPVFINPTDARVAAEGSRLAPAIGVMGQWYIEARDAAESRRRHLTAGDAAEIEFFAEELKTQPAFPPALIEFQAGWYTPGDDDRPFSTPAETTLLSARLFIANGIHGINYFPLQDTYTPAGYSVPWANRSYRWDAALGPDGDAQPRLAAVKRNSAILRRWGPELAASHKRADFGILYPMGAYPQELLTHGDVMRVSRSAMRLERLAALAMLSSELVDAEYQPLEQLLRDPLLLLPVFDPDQPQFQLSETAQKAIVEYVRRGGTLVVFPARPAGKIIEQLWKSEAVPGASGGESAISARRKFGEGEVIESSKDFFSWVKPERSLAENRAQPQAAWSIGALRGFLAAAGIAPATQIAPEAAGASELIATELVSNEGTGALGARSSGRGFLSVTNLGAEQPAEATFHILSPSASARENSPKRHTLHVVVPPRESMLVPLEQPLCFADPGNAPCGDEINAAGAELLGAEREGKTLKLSLYVPARGELFLHLAEATTHITVDDTKPEMNFDDAGKSVRIGIPRGAAPHFHRTVNIELPYKPHVPEAEKMGKPSPADLEFFVANAARL
ncbi:MAG TPA: beta-galactosidase, partial [archaeon]|nr:beta-galactosidase [archaeon]